MLFIIRLDAHIKGERSHMKDIDPAKFYETFERELNSDDERWSRKGKRILEYYNRCTQQEQAIINDLFIELCGWSLETLVEMSTEKEED
jgi:hypothetical protein